jgi:hypothetical protein
MVLVARDSMEVRVHASPVGEHLFLVVQIPIGTKVVGEIDSLVNRRRGGRRLRGPGAPVLLGSHSCQLEKKGKKGKKGQYSNRRNEGGSAVWVLRLAN